ncbi:hypothetical protein IKG02_00510 [Candidatus Saccharibacteria bacterium]|nr:hypothetical protein [Candidatus Saccharibacteria bacterium]
MRKEVTETINQQRGKGLEFDADLKKKIAKIADFLTPEELFELFSNLSRVFRFTRADQFACLLSEKGNRKVLAEFYDTCLADFGERSFVGNRLLMSCFRNDKFEIAYPNYRASGIIDLTEREPKLHHRAFNPRFATV